jgi:amidophosphoribosyltransferase
MLSRPPTPGGSRAPSSGPGPHGRWDVTARRESGVPAWSERCATLVAVDHEPDPADSSSPEAGDISNSGNLVTPDADDPSQVDYFAGKPREACGVFGVYAPGLPVAHLTYLGLYALQHRGQESAGIATSNGDHLTVVKDMGLVSNVFDDRKLAALDGDLAIGHTRYSTTGSSMWKNSQPVFRDVATTQFALGHNGNLVNTASLVEQVGILPGTVTSDTDAMAEWIAKACDGADRDDPDVLEHALGRVLPHFDGAFSLVLMDRQRVIGVRDPHGFRPLCLGKLDSGWVLASESPALDIVGAHFIREIEPGEMVVIDAEGVRSLRPFAPRTVDPRLCLFEFVYFARPDAQLYGQNVHQARVRMGEQLADQAPVDGDMVIGVPESGIPAAEGYARRSGIPFGHGLVKNRYIGRTFIAPSQDMRALGVRMKLNPLRENIEGRRLVVVDDSIVRGTTTRAMVAMLREAGAREVHLRVSSPPYRWPCFYGMDTGSRGELLAANMEVDEIRAYLGVDTLSYLTLDRLIDAAGAPGAGFCTACLTGVYPVAIPPEAGKGVLEGGTTGAAESPVAAVPSRLLSSADRLLPTDSLAGVDASQATLPLSSELLEPVLSEQLPEQGDRTSGG